MQKPDGDEAVNFFEPRCCDSAHDLMVSSVFQRNVSIVASHCEEACIHFTPCHADKRQTNRQNANQFSFFAVSISVDRDSVR